MTSKRKTKRRRRKSKTRKTFKGGFLSEASYLINKVDSFFSVYPTTPTGNASIPVPPFFYSQTK
jgi:hypothetical protein